MQTNITSERGYSITYFRPQSKNQYGISVAVTGDHKVKVLREAKELLEKSILDAIEIHKRYEANEDTNRPRTES
jgi:hypothetical protein